MKNIISFIIISVLIGTLLSCGSTNEITQDGQTTNSTEATEETSSDTESSYDFSSKFSMAINYPDLSPSLMAEATDNAFTKVQSGGVDLVQIYYNWGELESDKETFNWTTPDFDFFYSNKHNLKTSFIIKLIDTNNLGSMPKDIAFKGFDDPVFKTRFQTFALTILARYKDSIDYLWIGNEIDEYFVINESSFESYVEFYKETYSVLKGNFPNVTIGTISTYHSAQSNNALRFIEDIGASSDVIGLSLYPQMITSSSPTKLDSYFSEMSSLSQKINKKIAITETGWSTEGNNGSLENQKLYLDSVFAQYAKHNAFLEYFGLFTLYDFSDSLRQTIAESFGQGASAEFADVIGTLGYATSNGDKKDSWNTLFEGLSKFR